MNWRKKIEAQIAELQHEGWYATDNTEAGAVAATMRALLDVAVAAESSRLRQLVLEDALENLRELE